MMVNTLKDLFEVMDVENSGCVDQLGFQVGLIHIGVNLPEETLTQVFAQVDENADGNVTYEEFSQFLKSREQTGPAQRVQEALLRCQARGITANLTNNAGLPNDLTKLDLNSYGDVQHPPGRTRRDTMTSDVSEDRFELQPGDKVLLNDDRVGSIKFFGKVDFSPGEWYGIDLDLPFRGSNDGKVQGRRYFRSKQAGQGIFVRRIAIIRKLADKEYKKVKRASIALRRGESIGSFRPDLSGLAAIRRRMERRKSSGSDASGSDGASSDDAVQDPGSMRTADLSPIPKARARAMSISLFENAGIRQARHSDDSRLDYDGFRQAMRKFGLPASETELRMVFLEIARLGGHEPNWVTREDVDRWLTNASATDGFKGRLLQHALGTPGEIEDDLDDSIGGSFDPSSDEGSDYATEDDAFFIHDNMNLTEKQLEERLKRTFRRFDADGDGYLDEGEFRNAWMRMNLNGSPEDIKECFENIDTDNSGKIDLFEFINAIKTRAFDAYREYNDDSIDTDTQTEESPEGSPEPVPIMGARRRGDTLNSKGRRESLTRQPSITPTGTLYDEESDLINGPEVQATLDQQSKEIQKLKMQLMHLRQGAQQIEERPSSPPEKGGKSPKEPMGSDMMDMSSAIRELRSLIQGVDTKGGDDDKSDVTTRSNIHDDSSVHNASSMQKPDTGYVAGGGRQNYWEEFQRFVAVKELFSEMKEDGRHITDVFEVRQMLGQLRSVNYFAVPPDDSSIAIMQGKSLEAVRGFLQNCPPNFMKQMKGVVDPPRHPINKVWNVLSLQFFNGLLTKELAKTHIQNLCDQFDQIQLRYSLVGNGIEVCLRPGLSKQEVRAYNRQTKNDGLQLTNVEREDRTSWGKGEVIEVFDSYDHRWYPGTIRNSWKYYGTQESNIGIWLECEWTDNDGNVWLETFARCDQNLKLKTETKWDLEDSFDRKSVTASVLSSRQSAFEHRIPNPSIKRKRPNQEIRLIIDTGSTQFVLKKLPSSPFLDVLHDVSAELSAPVEDILLLHDSQHLNLRNSNRTLQQLGLLDGSLLAIHKPPTENFTEPPQEAHVLSSKILNKVYGKYTRNLDYFHQTGEPPYPIENRIPQEAHEVPVHEPGASYRPSAKNYGKGNARTAWRKGSVLEIFSVSQQVWCKGKVQKIFTDTEGEWLQVSYVNPNGSKRQKQIKRFSDQLRPLETISHDVKHCRILEVQNVHPYFFGNNYALQRLISILTDCINIHAEIQTVQIRNETYKLVILLLSSISSDEIPRITQMVHESLKSFCTTLSHQDPLYNAYLHTLHNIILISSNHSLSPSTPPRIHSRSPNRKKRQPSRRRQRTVSPKEYYPKRSLDENKLVNNMNPYRNYRRYPERSSSNSQAHRSKSPAHRKRHPRSASPFFGKRRPDRFMDRGSFQKFNDVQEMNSSQKYETTAHIPKKLKVAKLFSRNDYDNDGYLNFIEMQKLASKHLREHYSENDYQDECRQFRVDPEKGFAQSDLLRLIEDSEKWIGFDDEHNI